MKKLIVIIFTLGITLGLGTFQKISAQEVVVIVNKDNSVTSMKQVVIKLYYLKKIKKSWPDLKVEILPVMLSGSSKAKSEFHESILKMSETETIGYFKQRQFSNAEAMPATFSTEKDIIDYVSKNKGAIGYVSRASFDSSGNKVKLLRIE